MRRARHAGAAILLVVVLAAATGLRAQTTMSTLPPGLTERELGDPLEPLSLEPNRSSSVPLPGPEPILPALPDTTGRTLPAPELGSEERPHGEGTEQVLVVTCRQLLVSDPRKAERLGRLLRSGAKLEEAEKALGRVDLDEATREYAIDDLQPELRAEVESLSVGGWSGVRPWHGRSSLFQVVAKEERPRGSVPELGQNLDAQEQERIAKLQRANSTGNRPPVPVANADVQPAAVVEQATAQYPPNVQESADVSVQVTVGLSDDYVDARILNSSNALFDQPSLDAAQRSKYRSARRNGIPERGTVTLNFHFVAPGQGTTPDTPPPND